MADAPRFAFELLLADPATRERQALVTRVMDAALSSVEPGEPVRRALLRDDDQLPVAGKSYDLGRYRGVVVVGAGIPGAPMAAAVEEVLGDEPDDRWRVLVDRRRVPTGTYEPFGLPCFA
jgi:glycerate-2-kinase